jgi:D-alanine transaminase
LVYLNGSYIQKNKAFISVMDRGFLFGDGIYEVFPVYNNSIFGLDSHLIRLQKGLDAINIQNPHSKDEWINLINKIISLNNDSDNQAIYLQISRGCDEDRKHTHAELIPTVYIQSSNIKHSSKDHLLNGRAALCRDDIRWSKCNTKATSLLANTMYAQEAKENSAEETILSRNGVITEGSSSNVFIVKNKYIYTHPKGALILPGITREYIIECAKRCGIKLYEVSFGEEELFNADEVWVSSSTREVIPITSINGKQIKDGLVGPVWSLIYDQYQILKTSNANLL